MAKYDATKFYWLQLKEDFFDEDAIDWLEEQPNGKEYSLFYLKLCLKSLRTHGVLIRKVGNMLVPYDHVKLGELTKTNPDTVMVAMQLLTKIGLVRIMENGELYLTQVENMIGSQSKSAFKKQQQRLNKTLAIEGGQKEDICPPDIEIELEKDKELEIELEKDKELEEEKKNKKKSANAPIEYFSNETLNTLFIEFLEVRKKLKAVNSDRAIKMLINKLNKYDDDIKIKMIENSIVNSWKDVYELKGTNTQGNNKNAKTSEFKGIAETIREHNSNVDIKDEDYYKNLNF
jgi:predicted phage replisome organizer